MLRGGEIRQNSEWPRLRPFEFGTEVAPDKQNRSWLLSNTFFWQKEERKQRGIQEAHKGEVEGNRYDAIQAL